jgi:methionyl-tRNA formyltransferase
MNIVFMGTPDFAIPSLEILLKHKYHISGVVTAPDKPRGRGQHVSESPVKAFALQHSLRVLQPESLKNPDFIAQISEPKPDLFVVVAFRILPPEVFTVPRFGSFNLHASLLPKYRGAAPINWAILNGEKESGVTTFFLDKSVDTGNIILQARVAITETMNAGELHDALSVVGAEIVLHTVRLIETGKADPHTQDPALASPAPKIFNDDCHIDWNQSTDRIYNFVRGLSPYPAAWTNHNGKVLKIYSTERIKSPGHGLKAGDVVVAGSQLCVATADAAIRIVEIQLEGKKRMSAEEFLRGYKFNENDKLG